MGRTVQPSQLREVRRPERFTDLEDPTVPRRLTNALQNLSRQISEDRIVEKMPRPESFIATAVATGILLTWHDLPMDLWKSVHGAEIWRANQTDDPSLNFFENNAKSIIVQNTMMTSYFDAEPGSGDVVTYWLRWRSMDGEFSNPTDGAVETMP